MRHVRADPSVSTPSSRRIEAHPASGGAVVKPDVAGEGLTTAPPGANQYERRLDEPAQHMCPRRYNKQTRNR